MPNRERKENVQRRQRDIKNVKQLATTIPMNLLKEVLLFTAKLSPTAPI